MTNAIENLESVDAADAACLLSRATHNANIGRDIALICDPQTGEYRTRNKNECSPDEYYQKQGPESLFVLAVNRGYSCEDCTEENEDECDNLIAEDVLVDQIAEAIANRISAISANA